MTVGMTCRWVVPFNRTGYIRNAPGTAHRPFPTVSLVGGTVEPHGLYSLRCMVVLRAANQNLLIAGGNHTLIPSMNHRRYIAYFHSSAQVVSGTWRAADCRPGRCNYRAVSTKRYHNGQKTFPHTFSTPVDKTRKLEYSIDTKGATSRSAPPEFGLGSNRVCGKLAVTSYFYDQVSQ